MDLQQRFGMGYGLHEIQSHDDDDDDDDDDGNDFSIALLQLEYHEVVSFHYLIAILHSCTNSLCTIMYSTIELVIHDSCVLQGDVELADGQRVENLLVVNKVCLDIDKLRELPDVCRAAVGAKV